MFISFLKILSPLYWVVSFCIFNLNKPLYPKGLLSLCLSLSKPSVLCHQNVPISISALGIFRPPCVYLYVPCRNL